MAEDDDDRELLEAWAKGDNSAGTALIRRYFEPLNLFFINKVPEADRGDLIQQTLLNCTTAIDRFRGDSKVRTFVLSIARNVLLHYYRKKGRKFDKLDPLTHSVAEVSASGAFTKLARAQKQQALLTALRQLPIDLQIVLELKYWEKLTADQCSVVLQTPTNTVSSRVRRAKQKLAEIMKAAAEERDRLSGEVASDRSAGGDEIKDEGSDGPTEGPAASGFLVDDDSSPVASWMEEVRQILGGDPHALLKQRHEEDESEPSTDDES